jgi:hypothetical protein
MLRWSLLAPVALLAVSACHPITDEPLNHFCEQNLNCAAGLTCDPGITGYVCGVPGCDNSVPASACCDAAHLCGPACCTEGQSCSAFVQGVGEVCVETGSGNGVSN